MSYTYRIVVDGGSLGNHSKEKESLGYGSAMIFLNERFKRLSFRFGSGITNNEAEYMSLIAVLKHISDAWSEAAGKNVSDVSLQIEMDSALVIGQLRDGWKVKAPNLRPLHAEAFDLLARFAGVTWKKIPEAEMKFILGH